MDTDKNKDIKPVMNLNLPNGEEKLLHKKKNDLSVSNWPHEATVRLSLFKEMAKNLTHVKETLMSFK